MRVVWVLLSLLWCSEALSGVFLQLSDLHLDNFYKPNSSIVATSCHDLTGTAERFGERWFCDSPEDLVDRTLKNVAAKATNVDFIVLTGDSARHDDYSKIPMTLQEMLDENNAVAQKIAKFFPNVPVIPSIGNNDVFPHDSLAPPGPGNQVLQGLATAWAPLLSPQMQQAVIQGGWMAIKPTKGGNVVISLNTIYLTFMSDCNNSTSMEQMEWLSAQLHNARVTQENVIITGHIPPNLWFPFCRKLYVQMSLQFENVITAHLFGHTHKDQFHLIDRDGSVDGNNTNPGDAIPIMISPSVVPTWNPSFRVFQYDPHSFEVLDYTQYYADIQKINTDLTYEFEAEYSMMEAYNVPGENRWNLSSTLYWCRLFNLLQTDTTAMNTYLKYEYVSSNTTTQDCSTRPLLCV